MPSSLRDLLVASEDHSITHRRFNHLHRVHHFLNISLYIPRVLRELHLNGSAFNLSNTQIAMAFGVIYLKLTQKIQKLPVERLQMILNGLNQLCTTTPEWEIETFRQQARLLNIEREDLIKSIQLLVTKQLIKEDEQTQCMRLIDTLLFQNERTVAHFIFLGETFNLDVFCYTWHQTIRRITLNEKIKYCKNPDLLFNFLQQSNKNGTSNFLEGILNPESRAEIFQTLRPEKIDVLIQYITTQDMRIFCEQVFLTPIRLDTLLKALSVNHCFQLIKTHLSAEQNLIQWMISHPHFRAIGLKHALSDGMLEMIWSTYPPPAPQDLMLTSLAYLEMDDCLESILQDTQHETRWNILTAFVRDYTQDNVPLVDALFSIFGQSLLHANTAAPDLENRSTWSL